VVTRKRYSKIVELNVGKTLNMELPSKGRRANIMGNEEATNA